MLDTMTELFDTPLTVSHEVQCLQEAGFNSVQVLKSRGATVTIRADRRELKKIQKSVDK